MFRNPIRFMIAVTGIVMFSQCTSPDTSRQAGTKETSTKETQAPEKEQPEAPEPAAVKFRYAAYPVKGIKGAVAELKKQYSKEQQRIIYALNRVDEGHVVNQDTLIIPDTFLAELAAYSPFPQTMDQLTDVDKLVVFSYAIQAFAAYEHGKQVYWGPTSMGSKIHKTPTGLFSANWKAKETISTVDDEWKLKWNFNIENREGVGWHQYALPGYPASHSCLRMFAYDAEWMYSWAQQWILKDNALQAKGTPVVVFGAYPFGSRRPWRNQIEDPAANIITAEALSKEINPFLEQIKTDQGKRKEVEAARETAGKVAQP
jgi:hypothetical protein